MSAANFWNYNLDNIFISQRFGENALGVYNRAFQLYMVPVAQFIWPLERVVLVHSESKIEQDGSGAFLLRMQNQLHLLSGFAFSVLGSIGYLLVPMLLGPNWSGTSQVLNSLCIAGLIQVPMLVSHWGFLTSGKNSGLFSIGLIRLVSFAIALAALGTKLEYVAFAVTIANIVSWNSSLFWLHRKHPNAEVKNLLNNAFRILLSGGLTIGLVPLAVAFVRPDSQFLELVIAICFSVILFLSLLLIIGTRAQRSILNQFLHKALQKTFLGRHVAK
jgi:PST family polysaccharide transporter